MSAYQVSPKHIAALTANARRYSRAGANDLDVAAMAECLAQANADSVNARYNESEPAVEFGPTDFDMGEYTRLSPVACLKALQCFEYQACEHPGWDASEAAAHCRAFRTIFISALPGYADAPRSIA